MLAAIIGKSALAGPGALGHLNVHGVPVLFAVKTAGRSQRESAGHNVPPSVADSEFSSVPRCTPGMGDWCLWVPRRCAPSRANRDYRLCVVTPIDSKVDRCRHWPRAATESAATHSKPPVKTRPGRHVRVLGAYVHSHATAVSGGGIAADIGLIARTKKSDWTR